MMDPRMIRKTFQTPCEASRGGWSDPTREHRSVSSGGRNRGGSGRIRMGRRDFQRSLS